MNVALFGDLGQDRYIIVEPRSLSAEAPIPVFDQVREVTLPGMAGNVGANLNAFGILGKMHFSGGNRPAKNRLVTEDGHQIARFDVSDWTEPYRSSDFVDQDWDAIDLIVVADYQKGAMHLEMIEFLNGLGKPMFVDTKGSPAWWRHGQDDVVLFPNLKEYTQFSEAYDNFPNVILKQGPLGAIYMQYGQVVLTRPSVADPAKIRCVNGAGDTVLAALVAAEMLNFNATKALEFAMAAAANVCEQSFEQRTTSLEAAAQRMKKTEYNFMEGKVGDREYSQVYDWLLPRAST